MEYYPLTTPQKNIWNLQKYYADTAISNLCGAVFYQEKRQEDLMKQSIRRFIGSQSGIRLRFCEKEEPMQYVCPEENEDIPVMTFTSMEEFDRYAEDFAGRPLGLTDGAMYRFVVFYVEERSGILVVLSHLVADAWTFGLMANQLDIAYRRLEKGIDEPLMQGDYRTFIEKEAPYPASERYRKDKLYWEQLYTGRPEESTVRLNTLPDTSAAAGRITRVLPFPLERKLEAFCRECSVTPAVLFETTLILYLSRLNPGNRTVTLGVPVLNRSNAKEKEIAGMFVSTMPLTVEVEGGMSVLELARRIGRGHMDIFRHQKYPYSEILRTLREKQNFSGNLYDVMVSYQNAKTMTETDTKWYSNGYSEVPLTVHIDNRDGKESHTVNVDYQTAVFRPEEISWLLKRLEYILEQALENKDTCIENIDILPEREQKKVTEGFNDTAVDYPRDKCVHELFEEQVKRTPDRVAVVFEDKKFTYRQLDTMSNGLARFLRKKGVRRGEIVPFIAKRSWHIVTAMLGILKAGGTYMPISPDYPADRIRYMVQTAGSRIILQYGYDGTGEAWEQNIDCVDLESLDFGPASGAVGCVNRPEDPCYVIFTSGSTGTPKGVTISHRNVVNYCDNNNNNVCHKIIKDDCTSIVSVTNIVFDIFVTETFLPLLNGMTVYFADDEETMRQERLAGLIGRNYIDVMQTTPTRMRSYMLDKEGLEYLHGLKVIILGGESFPADLYGELRRYTDAHIYNIYGPAETTVWSSSAPVGGPDITIGRPIANTQIYILNENNTPVPIGIPGELCIARDGVGLGYLNRPELTARRFAPNPFATRENGHGKVMYHSGDLARWRTDGEIEYLGRMDTQVKIRGLRIELGEIESVMAGFPGIRLTAVTDKKDEHGRQYLVGYYTSKEQLDEKELRRYLASRLPQYMIPNYFLHLSAMPMTPSGKTDRKNLPMPDLAVREKEYLPPETETEKKLAGLWEKLLDLPRVGRFDDFFELGGDSLLAISLLNEIMDVFSVEISVKDVMEKPVLEQLALCIEQSGGQPVHGKEEILPLHEDRYALLPQQKAIYAACRKDPSTLLYNMPARIPLPYGIDRERLRQAVRRVTERRRILKSYILSEGNEIYGIYDETAQILFEDGEEKAFVRPFDLDRAPLFRVGFTEKAMLFDIHHIIADGETVNLLLRDIARAYGGEALPERELWYGDYAAFFPKCDFTEYKEYYRSMLKCDFEKTELPSSGDGGSGGASALYRIPEELFLAVKGYARRARMTETMVFLGAYGILLSGYMGRRDILSSIILQNRTHRQTRDMAGMFVNTLPVHIPVEKDTRAYFHRIKELVLGLLRYQELPFWEIAGAVGMNDKTVVNTSFVYQADGEKKLILDEEEMRPQFIDTHTSKFDLSMEITPLEHGGRMRLEYDCAKYDRTLMDDLAKAYLRILGQLDKERITDMEILSRETYHRIIEGFNDTAVDYPRDKCVHELFEEQVGRTPDRVALVFEGRKFTYRQLNEMSNSLAYFLMEKGIRNGDKVAVFLKRNEKVIMAQLAVLKLGAVFIPIDSRYPQDRIEYILQESNARMILKNMDSDINFQEECIIEECDFSAVCEFDSCHGSSDGICYIIFTSGSTGQPKGCVLTNRGLVNFCRNNNILEKCNQLKEQICVSVNTISFDFFIAESLMPLLNGYSVVLANEQESVNNELFARLVVENHANIIQTTPTRYGLLFSEQKEITYGKQFQVIVSGGEKLTKELLYFLQRNTNASIFNICGPSECSVWGMGGEQFLDDTSITIGRPIANTQIYILDSNNNPLPIGVPGELCIAGDGVGLGYLNRPDLTAQRFVPNPFATQENGHGKVMYHTGDLARWRADGEIEYLGRMDTQVKIRGLRIELGEIENVMAAFPGIRLAAAADRKDEKGRQFLVGYYTAEEGVDERKLREHLSSRLPGYMVPNYFLRLADMPMTPSGKLDRKELPMPDLPIREAGYLAPETETQKELARIWQGLLGLEKVGKTDDFFGLGGDSLLAISMLNEIADGFSAELTMREVMEGSTLEQLACSIERHGEGSCHEKDRIRPLRRDRYVLLPQQKAIYAACKKDPEGLLYHMPAAIALPREIDRERLKQAIRRVAEHTKILKSRIAAEADEIYGVYDGKLRIHFEDYTAKETAPGGGHSGHFSASEGFLRPFDLEKGPLFRVGFTEDAMLFDIHHIIADGESVNLILRDIARAYEGSGLQETQLWYGDYASCFPALDFTEHKDYFKGLLACAYERLELPRTKAAGTDGKTASYRISEEVFSRAKRYAERMHLTDTMVFLGAYGLLLSGYTGKREILSSIILQNRTRRETRQMEGMFVNTLPVRFMVAGSIGDYWDRIRETVLDLFRYQELPFWEIADAVGMADKTVVNTSFIYQADGEKKLVLEGKELLPQPIDTHTAKFDFSMEITPLGHGGRMRLEYDCGKYDRALMDELADAYIRILGQLTQEKAADSSAEVSAEISVLSDEMRRRITEEFNDTAVDYPRDKCVHELFEEQADRTPDRVALVFKGRRFTYRQLDGMSNRIARFLRENGIKCGDVVPILAKRSWHIVAAMLGILKAGGAYMPVSPDYPAERIRQMLKAAGSRLLLQYGCGEKGKPWPEAVGCVDLESIDPGADTGRVGCVNRPEDLCYAVFTSGSTGTPKGVSVSHRNVVNYCDNNNNNVCHHVIDAGHRSIVSVTNIVFDIFVTETLLPLLNGMTVYFADEAEAMHQEQLADLVSRNRIDVIQTTPTRMRSYMLDKGNTGYLSGLKKIILGGEAFPTDLFHELRGYTDADIYNIYGPAETTVWSSNARVDGDDITIGRPIANTQIYILSENNTPVPIGVPGELCIAGDGVGLGYLNQPELTARRFVPNPFTTRENNHGKVMYRTGDLARWREDGEIEYLGRMDTQVKIRGLRIELGEIESAMAGFPGIQLTAAADKRDGDGRQFLVGYYTSAEELDEKQLRGHLMSRLPKYMVPNFLLRLAAMPMTPSGKTDRKSLPMPERTGRKESYVAAETETEKRLCALAEEVLGLERVGVEDDFFELGGDSLTAITYVAKAHELGIRIPLQEIFDHPTVRSLCAALEAAGTPVTRLKASDFEKYRALLTGGWKEETAAVQERALGNVLLTGATGFLGAHVLDCLMREETGKIYCLVRRSGEESPEAKLRRILDYYFDGRDTEALGYRLIVVEGDVEEEGLEERLPRDVQTVIHTAASVKHYGSYAYFHRINREGTRRMAEYADAVGARLIHISTLSVSGNSMADDFTVYRSPEEKQFDETSLYIGQPLDNVYVRSKFEAECQVYDRILEGLDAKVIRVGNLTNRLSDFRFQPNYGENAFLTRFKALLELGVFPDYLMPLYSEFSPVDKTAEGIVKIARYAGRACTYHLYSDRPVYHDRLLEAVRRLGIPMQVVDGVSFYETLWRTMGDERTAYLYEALQNDLDAQGRLAYDSNIHIGGDLTLRFLKKVGFSWNETDFDYIRGYVEYFRRLGYLRV